jgi:hypothetical protein
LRLSTPMVIRLLEMMVLGASSRAVGEPGLLLISCGFAYRVNGVSERWT